MLGSVVSFLEATFGIPFSYILMIATAGVNIYFLVLATDDEDYEEDEIDIQAQFNQVLKNQGVIEKNGKIRAGHIENRLTSVESSIGRLSIVATPAVQNAYKEFQPPKTYMGGFLLGVNFEDPEPVARYMVPDGDSPGGSKEVTVPFSTLIQGEPKKKIIVPQQPQPQPIQPAPSQEVIQEIQESPIDEVSNLIAEGVEELSDESKDDLMGEFNKNLSA